MLQIQLADSWDGLAAILHGLPPVDLACRGQSAYHSGIIKPRLDRAVVGENLATRLRLEQSVCQRFREHALNYLSDVEREHLRTRWLQLVLMGHYGAPTRLVDWTKSQWVAAYFAAFGDWETDGYVFGFQRDSFERQMRESFSEDLKGLVWGPQWPAATIDQEEFATVKNEALFEKDKATALSDWVATYYCRYAHFPRLVAQQGLFTFASKPNIDHWAHVSKLVPDACFIIRVSSGAKPQILRHLNSIGLNGATLFPGADGIGRSLEGFVRSWALDPKPSQFSD